MVKKLAIGMGVASLLVAGIAVAGTPFGGDDAGTVSSNKDTTKCEDSVGKNLAKAAACIIKCHKARADGKLTTDTDEDNCESNLPAAKDCKGKYSVGVGNSSKINAICPSCLGATTRVNLFNAVEALIDGNNDKVYCQGTNDWGGDDTGKIPDTKDQAKCGDTVGKAVAKAIACITKCHKARADGKLADDTAEDTCESGASPSSCKSKFTNAVSKVTCAPCDPNLFDFIESQVDTLNGPVYCGSPSGAFLE
jgi:hypothetical protein